MWRVAIHIYMDVYVIESDLMYGCRLQPPSDALANCYRRNIISMFLAFLDCISQHLISRVTILLTGAGNNFVE